MARRSCGVGLTAYFSHTAFDLDVDAIPESRSRDYLELRLKQINIWLQYLSSRQHHRYRGADRLLEQQDAGELMDIAYLQAVRQTIYETLKAL